MTDTDRVEQLRKEFQRAGWAVTKGGVRKLLDDGWTIEPPKPQYYANNERVYSKDSTGYMVQCTSAEFDNVTLAAEIAAYLNERYG